MAESKISVDLILKSLSEEAEKTQKRLSRASDVLLGPLNTNLSTTPYEVVYEEDRVKLKHYTRSEPEDKLKTPLLVVYALINRETMLDLQDDRSVVKTFLKEGIDLYMMDWGYPTRKDRFLTIDDHVNGYMDHAVDFIRKKHGVEKINLMGICMGGSFCVMYAALYPEKIKNLITTVTPSNFDTEQGLLHVWMKNLDVDKLIKAYGNIPGDLMNFGFLLLNPARLMIDKYVGFMENVDNKESVENFVRMERWIFDSPDVPGETFRQFIEDGYQKNLLIQSKMHLGGRRVDLKKITMPLLNFYGQFDHLVPPEACNKLPHAVGSKDVEDICLDTGHIGIYVSSKVQKQFAPKIAQWLKARDQEDVPAQAIRKAQPARTNKRKKVALPAKPVAAKQPDDRAGDQQNKAKKSKGKASLMQRIAEAI